MNTPIIWKDKVAFTLEKNYDYHGKWKSVEQKTKLVISWAKTKKLCLEETLKKLEEKGLIETIRCIEWNIKNACNKKELHSESVAALFKRYFNHPIEQFINRLYDGFDIIWFDSWLNTPSGISTKDYIKQKYGEAASQFIECIITL